MDATTKRQLVTLVAQMIAANEQARRDECEEIWVTSGELTKQFGMFTAQWLKMYGSTLPRTQAIVTDQDGIEHKSSWVYPRNKIAQMISRGEIKNLKIQ